MEAQNGGYASRISPDEAAEAQRKHPANHEACLAAALDVFAQDPGAALQQFPEFSEHFKRSEGRGNRAGDETL